MKWLSFAHLHDTYRDQIESLGKLMETPVSELLIEAATLMVVGMAFVFVFLTILIGAVALIGKVNQLLPTETLATPPKRNTSKQTQRQPDQAIQAAISAAVHQYRQDQHSQ